MHKERAIHIIKAGLVPPGQNLRFSICGYSMCPLLLPGSKVIVSPKVTPELIFIGDLVVITNLHCCDIMVHRVIFVWKKRGEKVFFLTKGDGSRAFDKVICADQILGEVIAIQKENRFINLSKICWRTAGFFIAVSSGISGLMNQWIGRCPLFSSKTGLKISIQFRRLFFLIHRMFLHAVILSLS